MAAACTTSSDLSSGDTASTSGPITSAPTATESPDQSVTTSHENVVKPNPLAIWEPCFEALECAAVAVPLDHGKPDGASIDIHLLKVPASGDRVGSIFVNPGGPGASGIDFVLNGFRLDAETSARYDVIGFDPRGVGASSPVSCQLDRSQGPLPDFSPDNVEEEAALDEAAEDFARSCQELDGALLPHLGTSSVARDLDLLRQAVGDEQLHYFGFSYGTLIGVVYADLFPQRVGHLVLDGVVDPTASLTDLLAQQAEAFELAFVQLDAACSDRLSCPDEGVLATHDQIVAELERTGPVGQMGATEVEAAALLALYNEGLWSPYVAALRRAATGDYSGLESLSDSFLRGVSFASYAAIVCIDSPRPADPAAWDRFADELTLRFARFGATIANELRTCGHWPVAGSEPRAPITAKGAAPLLVIGTTNDPATPLVNAERVAANLDQAGLVVFNGDRHTAYGASDCVKGIVRDYFLDNVVLSDTVNC